MHKRTAIRNAAVAALTGLPTTGVNVFVDEPHDVSEASLPCLRIDDVDEPISYESGTTPRQQLRSYALTIKSQVQSSGAGHDLRDTSAGEVETAMAAQVAAGLSGLVSEVEYQGAEFGMDGSGSTPIFEATLTYVFAYYTAEV